MVNKESEESRALLVPSDPQVTPELREIQEFPDPSESLAQVAPQVSEDPLDRREYKGSLDLWASRALWG